jgi:general secretion pathway protein E
VDPASATVIRLCDAMLKLGLKWGASDIHIEPRRSGDSEAVVVRYRVDGVLQPTRRMPGRLLEPVVDRLKLMAGMDLGERHVPQSGRIPVQHEGRRFEMRVTTLPVCGGEAATIRVLFRDASLPDIDHVDLAGDVRRTLDGLLRRPNGVILVSGPTGSGKTTTLYAALQSIAHDGVKVITVEDPVEFLLPYATQVQANPRGGVTTASAIRAMMQHDPDVIAVADVVDAETADLLVQAAMTGHLVLCQLHAQSAAHAIERFTGLCTDAYYASATLLGSLGQRLVRRICDACAASTDPESDAGRAMAHAAERLAEVAGPADGESAAPVWIVGRGCPACRCTGYRRRAAIHALICVDAEVTNAMRRRASADEIEALVAGQAIANMASDGLRKARAGVTTPEEVLRVLGVQP